MTTARLDGRGLLDRLGKLAESARSDRGGVTRLAWSREDDLAARMVAGWLASSGIATRTDAARNLVAELPGAQSGLPAIVVGSHFDTVVDGGDLDGAYGALAAFERSEQSRPLASGCGTRSARRVGERGGGSPPFTGSRVPRVNLSI